MSGSSRQVAWSWKRQIKWYAILFAGTAFLAFIPFMVNGKSFIWNPDGIEQHYLALQYYGMWLREIAMSVIHGAPSIPLWDFGIGYGSDILTTFAYYAIGDPLNLISAIVPSAHTEALYDALIVVRMFLAGLFFMVFCKRMGVSRAGALGGALAYAFCSWAIFGGLRHAFFLNPMVYLPLLLVGVEKILAKESPVLFIVMVAISALSNFYFLYMLVIMVMLYVIVRFFGTPSMRSVKGFFTALVKFALSGILGAAIAAVTLAPIVIAVLDSSRAGVVAGFSLLYPEAYYQTTLRAFTTTANMYWALIGVSAPALLGLPVLFANKGRAKLKVGFILFIVFLVFPVFGSILNGFSYTSNRWVWAYAMLTSFILASMWEHVTRPSRKELAFILVAIAAYALSLYLFDDLLAGNAFISLAIALFALVSIVLVGSHHGRSAGVHAEAGKQHGRFAKGFKGVRSSASTVLIVAIIVGAFANASCRYDADKSAMLDEFVDAGMAYEIVDDNPLRNVAYYGSKTGEFYRMGLDGESQLSSSSPVVWSNATVLRGISSTGFYWSLSSGTITDYYMDMALPSFIAQSYLGLDHRTFLNELAGVKYYMSRTRGETNEFIPFGYKAIAKPYELHERFEALAEAYKNELGVTEFTKDQERRIKWIYDSYRIDENQKPLPFGYSYGGYITEESFDAMDPARRQEALMQGAVLQDEDAVVAAGTMDEISPIFDSRELAFKVEPSDGIDEVGDVYVADKTSTANGSAIIHIDVDIPPACEAYVLVEGIEAHESTRLDQYLDDNANNAPRSVWDDLSTLEKSRIVLADRDRRSGIEKGLALPIKVSCADKTDTISYRPEGNPWGTGQTVFMANVGYSESARSGIDITFKEAGDYHFDGIKVIAQPMEHYGKWVDGLSEYTLQDVEFGVNEISGSIETDEARLLLLSMPYSTGWSATIDGEPAKLMRANGMFSGLLIEPGVHQIELHYVTPGLKYGLAATAAGLIILIVIAFLMRGKRKRARKADDDTLTGGKDGFIDLAKHRDTNEA